MTVLAILVAGYAIVQYYVLGPDTAALVNGKLEEQTLNWIWYGMLYVHVAGSVAALVLGPFNLRKSLREKRPQLHRLMGRCYVVGIAFGGLTGVYLAFQATGGLVSMLGFLGLAIGWLGSAYMAVKTIRANRPNLHRRWMIRNYALTLAAVMLRLWLGIFMFAFGGENFVASYTVIAWLCWVPNVIAAEWYLRRRKSVSTANIVAT